MMKQRNGLTTHGMSELKKNSCRASMAVGPTQGQYLGTIQQIKALRQGRHWVWGLIHHRATKEKTIAINRC